MDTEGASAGAAVNSDLLDNIQEVAHKPADLNCHHMLTVELFLLLLLSVGLLFSSHHLDQCA